MDRQHGVHLVFPMNWAMERDGLPGHGELLIVVGVEMRLVTGNVQEPFPAWILTLHWRREGEETLVFHLILQTWHLLFPRPPENPPPGVQWF